MEFELLFGFGTFRFEFAESGLGLCQRGEPRVHRRNGVEQQVRKGLAAKGMDLFEYQVDQANNKKTNGAPTGWTKDGACWSIRKDGSCQ